MPSYLFIGRQCHSKITSLAISDSARVIIMKAATFIIFQMIPVHLSPPTFLISTAAVPLYLF